MHATENNPRILVVTPEVTYLPDSMGNIANYLKAKAGGLKIGFVIGKESPHKGKAEEAVKALEGKGIPAKLLDFDGGKEKKLPEGVPALVKQILEWMM